MNWTKTKPTKPGNYYRTTAWARVVQAKVFQHPTGLRVTGFGKGHKLVLDCSDDFFWIGPMPQPPAEADIVRAQKPPTERMRDE